MYMIKNLNKKCFEKMDKINFNTLNKISKIAI